MITEFAPAKVNLALHVTGRRADGYHLLDSLVVFVGAGDRVTVSPANCLSLTITGPQVSQLPVTDNNLVLRAARAFGQGKGAAITLEKVLPVASGIGGGSADAAATLRALARLWATPLPDAPAILALGADVPVCLAGHAARMEGIGEIVTTLPFAMPPAWLVLVNPNIALPTPAVFAALTARENSPLPTLTQVPDLHNLLDWLHTTRNDLEASAIAVSPIVADVKAVIAATEGCLLARMSGSGATCFGLFASAADASAAAKAIALAHPHWWVTAAPLLE